MGTGSFPGVKSSRGVTLTPDSLLVPWSRKSRPIPFLPLWAVRPVNSLSSLQGCNLPLPSRQATAAHSQGFVVNYEWLSTILKAFAQCTRSIHTIRNARCFQSVCSNRNVCRSHLYKNYQSLPYNIPKREKISFTPRRKPDIVCYTVNNQTQQARQAHPAQAASDHVTHTCIVLKRFDLHFKES